MSLNITYTISVKNLLLIVYNNVLFQKKMKNIKHDVLPNS